MKRYKEKKETCKTLKALAPYIYIYISRFYRTGKNVCTANGKTSVIENCAKQELNRIEIKEDLRKDIKLSLICDIEKIKRTSYLKVVRVKKREEKLELQESSLSFF